MDLDALLRRQAGVITTAQACDAGLSGQAVRRRVRSGARKRLSASVHLVGCHPIPTRSASVRRSRPLARERLRMGAPPHGGTGSPIAQPVLVEVTVPRRRAGVVSGVRVRRRDLRRNDVATFRQLQVTAVPLTVLEAAVAGPDGSELLDRALQQWVHLEMLCRVHERNLGRRGSAEATALLAAAADEASSRAERLLHRLLRRAGIEGWRVGCRSLGYEIDVAFPARRLAVEVDGWAWHSGVDRFRWDRQRQNALVNAGWRVLRFTWHDLTARPEAVIAEIRAALAA